MEAGINWLHLSDLHRGARGEERDWLVVRDALQADLERLHRLVGPPDLILFTGDLAMSGSEYDAVEGFFDWLDQRLGRLPVFAVPGNHDLVRPTAARRWRWLFADDDASVAERAQELRDGGLELAPLFAPWQEFHARRLAPRLPGLRPGLLPGDGAWTLDKHGLRLGLLGLNSAWRQFSGEDFRGRVSISPLQVHALLPDGALAWQRDHHLTLLLQHHPPEWLDPRDHWDSHVATAAHAVLYGHMHQQRAAVSREESNEHRVHVQARSLFGLERYGRANESRSFGYRWGRIEAVDRGEDGPATRLRTGARTLVERQHRWAFCHPELVDYDEALGMCLVDVPVPGGLSRPAVTIPRVAAPPPSGPPPALAAPPAEAPAPGGPPDLPRARRYAVLCNLLEPAFDRVLLLSEAPMAHLPPRGVALATRALAAVQWIEVQPRATRRAFDDQLRAEAPGEFE